jgi:hypothetical protein
MKSRRPRGGHKHETAGAAAGREFGGLLDVEPVLRDVNRRRVPARHCPSALLPYPLPPEDAEPWSIPLDAC